MDMDRLFVQISVQSLNIRKRNSELIVCIQVKEKCSKMYDLETVRFEDIFAGPAPQFMETQRKNAILNKVSGQYKE